MKWQKTASRTINSCLYQQKDCMNYQKSCMPTVLFVLALFLVACQSTSNLVDHDSVHTNSGPSVTELKFIDLSKFDHELYRALNSTEPEIKVVMFEKISPNNTPDRLQKWLNAVEKNGGKVEIEPPPNELVPRNPFALIGLIGGLWDAVKAVADFRESQLTHAVKGRDAVISLERNSRGEIVISKLIFKKI
jgi:hypothetical protein